MLFKVRLLLLHLLEPAEHLAIGDLQLHFLGGGLTLENLADRVQKGVAEVGVDLTRLQPVGDVLAHSLALGPRPEAYLRIEAEHGLLHYRVPAKLSYALALIATGSLGVLVLGPLADRFGRRRLL